MGTEKIILVSVPHNILLLRWFTSSGWLYTGTNTGWMKVQRFS